MPKKKKIAKVRANQFEVDPRQAEFIARYCNPESETFANATQSAIAVGYSKEYAKTITTANKWLSENISAGAYPEILRNSTKNLQKFTSEEYKENDKIKLDATKFSLQALNRDVFGAKVQVHNTNENLSIIEANIRVISEGGGKKTKKSNIKEVIDTLPIKDK